MADPITLGTILYAGAQVLGDAAVKEATKDAYGALKEGIRTLFGRRAEQAIAKLEVEATREEGRTELAKAIPDLNDDEAAEIAPLVQALVAALRDDPAAKETVHARVGLDLDSGGNILVDDIQGAREVALKARADGDVTIRGFRMDPGGRRGN